MNDIVKSFQAGFTPFIQNDDVLVIRLWLMYKWVVEKRSSVPTQSGLRCKPHRSTYENIRLAVRFLARLASEHF
jgi:hypothetical protein